MTKKYRRLQHISTIPILAAMLLTSNPSAVVNRQRVNDVTQSDTTADLSIVVQDVSDSRLRNK